MSDQWTYLWCGISFFVFMVVLFLWDAISRRGHLQEQILTPEQGDAVRRQGNALGILIFIQFGLVGIGWVIVKLFPALEEQVKSVGLVILVIAGMVVAFYIAISSIKDEISMFHSRDIGEYPTGLGAIQWGIFILVVIGLILYVGWLKLTGQ